MAIKIKEEDNSTFIFDPVRKKWLLLTPEEWVRQNFVMYLNNYLHFPLSLMETEKQFKLFNTIKRADIVLNNNKLKPIVVVECKAPEIKLDKEVFDQAINYNMAINADYIYISNGLKHFAIDMKSGKPQFMDYMPDYNTLTNKKLHD